jgi:hypothetical protein
MRLDRDKAFFTDSRLYRQAEETADHLLQNLQVPVPLADAVSCLRNDGQSLIFGPGELDQPLRALQDEIERSIDSISPYHAIPALFRVVTKLRPPRPAAARTAKILAIRVQRRVWTDTPGLSASWLGLVRAARLTYAEQLLRSVRTTWALHPSGHAEMSPEGVSFDPGTEHLLQAGGRALSGGGTLQRFSGPTVRLMSENPVGFLLDVCAVLAGDPPVSRRSFAGTYLVELPGADMAHRYWFALAARLLLLEHTRRIAGPVHDDPHGIAILGRSGAEPYGPAVERLTRQDMKILQQEVIACFWNRRSLASVPTGIEEAHAFVDRPACRIVRGRELYVTSAGNIVDSLTALTEKAVGPYSGRRPYPLPQQVFDRLVSKPFERAVVELFRAHGFLAGEVTAKGTRLTQDGTIEKPSDILRPRGQIDVLAWHPTGHVVVADCKILQLPYNENAMINLWKKLQDDDQEGYRRKVQAAAAWCGKFLKISHKAVSTSHAVLILDQPLHLWQQSGNVIVTDYPDLAEKLRSGKIPAGNPS